MLVVTADDHVSRLHEEGELQDAHVMAFRRALIAMDRYP
jgi:hypothetical protein